jgi:hypothetical protein
MPVEGDAAGACSCLTDGAGAGAFSGVVWQPVSKSSKVEDKAKGRGFMRRIRGK